MKTLMLLFVALGFCVSASVSAGQSTIRMVNGMWYQEGAFVSQIWYSIEGVLTTTTPDVIDDELDLRGGFVIPPLVEGHNHNLQNPWLANNFAPNYERAGILYGLMLCGSHHNAAETRTILDQTSLDIQLAGACISSSDGHPLRMALQSFADEGVTAADIHDRDYIVIDSIADIDEKWPLINASSSEFIKIILVHSDREERRGNPSFHGINGLQAELVQPLTAELQRRGLRVVAHVESNADFTTAVNAGVDIIAHLPGYRWERGYDPEGYRLSDAIIEQAAAQGTAVITTVSVSEMVYPDNPEQLAQVQALQINNLSRLHAAGVAIIPGTDRFDVNVVHELKYLQNFGIFTPEQLLDSAVKIGPQRLFTDRKIGEFKEGYESNFVVLQENPLQNIAHLESVALVVKHGEVVFKAHQK
ncbi:hypothetical protein FM042_07845 [Aliidiomarina halalkaliphila]|uniref:Amidohydrolase-related domain-containing protein n=1 Tax=Aliidiomarina halalkaliphila TaxID=2593535 RepID=A0A552X1Q9_9GAMM|nr:hypothetical protein [Aliidiomarina halalkaliphila]TRW48886.1 hypothetical protein FM042_07845 [Aliidiomarina halalkaliphila]